MIFIKINVSTNIYPRKKVNIYNIISKSIEKNNSYINNIGYFTAQMALTATFVMIEIMLCNQVESLKTIYSTTPRLFIMDSK